MRIFLSHSGEPDPFVTELAARLTEAGFDVWLDEQRLYPGDNWALRVGKALESSQAMVVVFTPEAARSARVARDIEFALGARQFEGRLIGVIGQPTKNIPWIFERLPVVRGEDAVAAAKKVAEELSRVAEVAGR